MKLDGLRQTQRLLLTLIVPLLLATSCGPGRPIIPPGEIPEPHYVTSEDEQYGQEVLSQLTRQYPLDRTDEYINRSRDIVMRLATAAHADQSPWNVYVLKGDNVVNAAATRGNFVFVWTGMLRMAHSDGELATVLAHEIGHVLAGHTQATPAEEANEIISNVGGQVVGQIVSATGYGALAGIAGAIVSSAYNALAVNPESQRKELEADHIGLFLMADAGYNPEEAISLWSRMEEQSGAGGGALQFLSTHPATQERLEVLRGMLPEAMERYRAASLNTGRRSKARPRNQDSGDSFALGPAQNRPQQQRQPSRRPTQQRDNEWRVVEPHIAVFSDPGDHGEPIARLEKGDRVTIAERVGRWYRIIAPYEGFVRGDRLSP